MSTDLDPLETMTIFAQKEIIKSRNESEIHKAFNGLEKNVIMLIGVQPITMSPSMKKINKQAVVSSNHLMKHVPKWLPEQQTVC